MYQSVKLTPKVPRMKFSNIEDMELKRLVQQSGEDVNWKIIADAMGNGRTSRQCRERYRNYLSPKLKNGPWTLEEESILEEKYQIFGPKWSKMTKFFKGRSDVNLKNHWVSMLNRKSKQAFETKQKIEIFTESPTSMSPVIPDEQTENMIESFQPNPTISQIPKQSVVLLQESSKNKKNSTISLFRDDRSHEENGIVPDEFELDCFNLTLDFDQVADPFSLANEEYEFSMFGY